MARHRSPSPLGDNPVALSSSMAEPSVPLSKRDKKRTILSDKLVDMVASFSENRDGHYRAQLAAIQADMNLIVAADSYTNRPLDDSGEEIAQRSAAIGSSTPIPQSVQDDYAAQVGRYYSKFVDDVNNALEARDYELTMSWNRHQTSKQELNQQYVYKVHLAKEEHKQLSNTLRERLIQSATARRTKLLREKELLDLSDSNALLLHPNQYNINNPASPGGPQNNRKTRHTRHRIGDPDDLVGSASENKRKRKAPFDDDTGSPGPAGRGIDVGIGSPFREAKAKIYAQQFEAPLYSIERLFTDKELQMNSNQALLATNNFFAKLRDRENNGASSNGVNGEHASGDETGAADGNHADEHADDLAPAAPEMERTVSHHLTRGATRQAMGGNGDLNATVERVMPFHAIPPVILPANVNTKTNVAAPTPAPLTPQDADHDISIMLRGAPPDDPLTEKFLEAACRGVRICEYEYQPPGFPMDSGPTSNLRGIPTHLDIGSIPMSAQSSMAGMSEVGPSNRNGERMSRTGSGVGNGRGRR